MMGYRMKKNQLVTTKSTSLILGKSKSLMGITKKILEAKSKELTTHTGITVIGDLMWEKESREMNWDDAMEYAKNLRLGGYDDWRLPNREELEDVVRLCGGEPVEYDDDNYDEITDNNLARKAYQSSYKEKSFTSNYYWSSTTHADYASRAWIVFFDFGETYGNVKTRTNYVRCVRAVY